MKTKRNLISLACAIAGGLLGHFGFHWLAQRGLYAMVLPGGAVGLGAGIPRGQSKWVAGVCAGLALVAGLLAEWHYMAGGEGLGTFLSHLGDLNAKTLTMMAAGTAIGFWVPFRRSKD